MGKRGDWAVVPETERQEAGSAVSFVPVTRRRRRFDYSLEIGAAGDSASDRSGTVRWLTRQPGGVRQHRTGVHARCSWPLSPR